MLVSATTKACRQIREPRLNRLQSRLGPLFREPLRQPLSSILRCLRSPNCQRRGTALEALALGMMSLLDLDYLSTPLRAAASGGAEARLLFHSDRLVFSRWQVHCKNTARVSLEDVAKEVGLIHLLKSNVIVVVSTGEIGPAARGYANKVMGDTNLCMILVNGGDLKAIEANPASIVDVFNREAAHAMKLKTINI